MARILALTSRLPFPPREGHQLRAWHLLKAMASRHQVTLASFVREDDDPSVAGPLRELLHGVHLFPIPSDRSHLALGRALLHGTLGSRPFLAEKYSSTPFRRRLAELAREADLVHFDMLPLMAHADCVPAGIPVVLNAHNFKKAVRYYGDSSSPEHYAYSYGGAPRPAKSPSKHRVWSRA